MDRQSFGWVAGLAVLVAGVIALGGQIESPAPPQEPTATESAALEATPTPVDVSLPEIPGVTPLIQRVLYRSGRAEAVDPGDVEELPLSVYRLLAKYGVPIRVAEPSGGEGL